MNFKEAELKYYLVADVLTARDRADYACGKPSFDARKAMFNWVCAHDGDYDISDAFCAMWLGKRQMKRLVTLQSGVRKPFTGFRYGRDYRPIVAFQASCDSCGFIGTVRSQSKLDAVCPNKECNPYYLKFL